MSLDPTRPRRRAVGPVAIVGALVVVVLVLLSPTFGRAPTGGSYRPLLPPDGLTNGCYPLPGGLVPGFAYVLRADGDTLDATGLHRRTVLHFDRVDAAEARRTIEAQFAAAGVSSDVRVVARDFAGPDDLRADDAVVRGEMVLDLPIDEWEAVQILQPPW